ncbi:MAG: large conductance mechanosensitive channel protein MscL [Bacteroidia bacterium]|nr:large conductance mechanosensitive channel protein MscL [Bacteroidia bacterium]
MIQEFKKFALKGNVIDLAVGVVIGGAFGKIVASLVEDIITPAVLAPALKAAHLSNLHDLVIPGTAIKYGNFLSNCISFLIVAWSLFLVIKAINKFNKKQSSETPPPPPPTKEEILLTEIRDILKSKN